MTSIHLKDPKPEDLALAARDALRAENATPFVLVGIALAVVTNILTAAVATMAFAYVNALWNRWRIVPGPK